MISSFEQTKFLLQRGLDVTTVRHQTISNNIANANTPGFKRMDITFEADLSRALDQAPPALRAVMTHEKHIPFFREKSVRDVKIGRKVEFETTYKNDKSNVDIEKEAVDLAKNTMRYSAMTSLMQNYFRKIDLVLKS